MQNRVLDMPKARCMTQDPIGTRGASGINLYEYGSNAPVVFTDRTGLTLS
jgi:RHS repeat-associated protein